MSQPCLCSLLNLDVKDELKVNFKQKTSTISVSTKTDFTSPAYSAEVSTEVGKLGLKSEHSKPFEVTLKPILPLPIANLTLKISDPTNFEIAGGFPIPKTSFLKGNFSFNSGTKAVSAGLSFNKNFGFDTNVDLKWTNTVSEAKLNVGKPKTFSSVVSFQYPNKNINSDVKVFILKDLTFIKELSFLSNISFKDLSFEVIKGKLLFQSCPFSFSISLPISTIPKDVEITTGVRALKPLGLVGQVQIPIPSAGESFNVSKLVEGLKFGGQVEFLKKGKVELLVSKLQTLALHLKYGKEGGSLIDIGLKSLSLTSLGLPLFSVNLTLDEDAISTFSCPSD